ncbi:MAG: hypothetical protein U0V74_09870 [Chitinophagales bacterium]
MKSPKTIWIVVLATAGLFLVLYFIFSDKHKRKYSWVENYKVKSREPFGTAFIYEMLDGQHAKSKLVDNKPIHEILGDSTKYDTGSNYVFVGADMHLSSQDARAILDYVDRGNCAFIGSMYFPDKLMEEVYKGECDEWYNYFDHNDTAAEFNFFHGQLEQDTGYRFVYRVAGETERYNWRGISGDYFCDSSYSMAPVGYRDSFYTNFACMPYGKGKFYMFSTPVVFTNYFMKDTVGLLYADLVFSHLNKGPVIWDEYSKLPRLANNHDVDTSTPLSYILSQKSLRYAWYLLLLGAILYLFLVARRRQRIIDVIEPNTNTSLSYVNTISALYFNHSNHAAIAKHKMKYFLIHVRSKYNINLHGEKRESIEALSKKSKVPVNDINKILRLYERIAPLTDITEGTLMEFHYALENFYNQSK